MSEENEYVYAVEIFESSHWTTIAGGMPYEDAYAMARGLAASNKVGRYSVAEYTTDEGTSAISREEMGGTAGVEPAPEDASGCEAFIDAVCHAATLARHER